MAVATGRFGAEMAVSSSTTGRSRSGSTPRQATDGRPMDARGQERSNGVGRGAIGCPQPPLAPGPRAPGARSVPTGVGATRESLERRPPVWIGDGRRSIRRRKQRQGTFVRSLERWWPNAAPRARFQRCGTDRPGTEGAPADGRGISSKTWRVGRQLRILTTSTLSPLRLWKCRTSKLFDPSAASDAASLWIFSERPGRAR